MAVNSQAWKKFPIAAREQTFDADDAIARIAQWASGSTEKFNSAFLWRNSNGPANNKNSYRLPIADIINGKPTLIPHAVFSAAKIMSGAHGGLEGAVSSEEERIEIKAVLTQIYDQLREMYGDPRVEAPWLLGKTPPEREAERKTMGLTASVSAWERFAQYVRGEKMRQLISVPNAESPTAFAALSLKPSSTTTAPNAEVNGSKTGSKSQDQGKSLTASSSETISNTAMKESVNAGSTTLSGNTDSPLNSSQPSLSGKGEAVPSVVAATETEEWSLTTTGTGVESGESFADPVTAASDSTKKTQEGSEGQPTMPSETDSGNPMRSSSEADSITAAVAPVAPPREWFEDPHLDGPTHLTVTADGRVFGHAAPWEVCHVGIRNDCVMAPKDRTGYKFFKNGTVLTADGTSVRVGKITMDTVHAPTRDAFGRTPGLIPTEAHYADTGKQIAVVAVGEDQFGIWVAGSVVPEASPEQVARLRRSPLSGDWRPEPHGYELAGLLAVTDPGFPIAAVTASGEPGAIQGAFMAKAHAHDAEPECSPCENREKLTAAADLFDTNMAKIEQMQRAARLAALKEG